MKSYWCIQMNQSLKEKRFSQYDTPQNRLRLIHSLMLHWVLMLFPFFSVFVLVYEVSPLCQGRWRAMCMQVFILAKHKIS